MGGVCSKVIPSADRNNNNNNWHKWALFEVASLKTIGHSWPSSTDCPHWVSGKGSYWLPTCDWQDLFTFDMFWLHLPISWSWQYQKILHYTCLVNCRLAIYFSSMGFLFLKIEKVLIPRSPHPFKCCLFSASLNFLDVAPIIRSLKPFLTLDMKGKVETLPRGFLLSDLWSWKV